jgi:hypothetical protein
MGFFRIINHFLFLRKYKKNKTVPALANSSNFEFCAVAYSANGKSVLSPTASILNLRCSPHRLYWIHAVANM